MIEPCLSFKCVKNRLALLGMKYMPYKNGGGYFKGPNRASSDLPYEANPICFVADRPDDTPVDSSAIMGWFQTLGLTGTEIATFWEIQDHADAAQVIPTEPPL